jgi:Tol biopolymer transport system component
MDDSTTRTRSASARTTKAPQTRTRQEPSRDLRLFGQGDVSGDLVFEMRAASGLEQHTTSSEGADFDPAVDPSGKRLVFASTRHSRFSHLYMKPIESTTLTQLTDESANDAQPVFSPDGRRVAFTSDRAGQWDIWIIDLNGHNAIQVTQSPMVELHPSWSPDGTRIVYCRVNPKESRGELWIANLDRPGVKQMIGDGLFPAWSPRADKIAFQRARTRGSRVFSVWTIELNGDEPAFPTEVASISNMALIAPSWSADGTQLAFSAVSSAESTADEEKRWTSGWGRADIGIVDADGRGLQRLTYGRGEGYSPYWASDDRIYFTAKFDRSETIWSVKPFRPAAPAEPSITTGPRRAAQAAETDQ